MISLLSRDTLNSMVENTSISEDFTFAIIWESYTFKLEVIGYFEVSVQSVASKATVGLFFIVTSTGTSNLTQPLILYCY